MDHHALSLPYDDIHESFVEERAHDFLREDSRPWVPNIEQPQLAVGWTNHAPLDSGSYQTDLLGVGPFVHLGEPLLDTRLATSMRPSSNVTRWSGYNTRTPWTDWNAADTNLFTNMQDIALHAPIQWLVDNGSVTFSDDIGSVRTGTIAPLATHTTQHAYVPASTTASRADSCINDALSTWEGDYQQFDFMEPFASTRY
jgi:hypothetical protein